VKAGVFRQPVSNSYHAELMAAINALHLGILQGVVRKFDTVLFTLDNDHALRIIQNWRGSSPRKNPTKVQRACVTLADTVRSMRLEVRVRYVKAHSGTLSPRTYVHDLCDKLARDAMRAAYRRTVECQPSPLLTPSPA
jgi:ribonuclease HI